MVYDAFGVSSSFHLNRLLVQLEYWSSAQTSEKNEPRHTIAHEQNLETSLAC